MRTSCSFSAPGKAILFGEHAVVYGEPALAIPLPQLRANALIRRLSQPLTVMTADLQREPWGWKPDVCDWQDPISLMTALTLDHLQVSEIKGEVVIRSAIPIASGLGSGAAVSTVLGRAIAGLADSEISNAALNRLVFEVEKLHHGTPSGIDNVTVVYESPVYFVKDRPLQLVEVRLPLHLIVADTGIAALTRDAVDHVRELYRAMPKQIGSVFRRIGTIVDDARNRIGSGDNVGLGELMKENHRLLQTLAVSCPELDTLVEAALDGGALGAKLSGGGRGGNIVAVVDERSCESVKARLIRAGAKRVIGSRIGVRSGQDDHIN